MTDKLSAKEITRLLNVLIGSVCPVADSRIDRSIKENIMTMIEVGNWMLGYICDSASYRHSPYASAKNIGELASAVLLDWKEWIEEVLTDDTR